MLLFLSASGSRWILLTSEAIRDKFFVKIYCTPVSLEIRFHSFYIKLMKAFLVNFVLLPM
jgi:hypothetical protein